MPRRLRFIPEGALVEITCRTVQARFLLKPGRGWRETFVGALARAQRLYPVDVHAFVCLSNHAHLLITPHNALELAAFMRHLLSKLSVEAGRRHGWRGPVFQRRYQAILVTDERRSQIHRLRYLLSHGVKENLVARVEDWPGPHCATALMADEACAGVWRDRTREWQARNRGELVAEQDFEQEERLVLAPLPCWRHLSLEQRQRRIKDLIADINSVAAKHRHSTASPYLGVRAVVDQRADASPLQAKRSPAPFCHAACKKVRRTLRQAYGAFVGAYREAAARLLAGDPMVTFPEGSFPPSLPFSFAYQPP